MRNEEKIEVARTLYLTTTKTQKEICGIVGWTEKTFTENKQKEKWNELKDARGLTKQQIITLLHIQTLGYVEQAKNENRLLTAREIDSVAKLASSIDKLEKKITIESYIEVFTEYNKFLMVVNANHAQVNNHFQDQFIQSRISK